MTDSNSYAITHRWKSHHANLAHGTGQRSVPNPIHNLIEEDSLYGFLDKAAAQLGVPIIRVCDGRTPLEVFWGSHFLGNSRWAPCSEELKQKPCRKWLEEHADPADTILYVGLDASPREQRRAPGIRAGWSPWRVEFPLQDEPDLTKDDMIAEAESQGLTVPEAYREGYGHANCSGLCVRGGQEHWRRTLQLHPDRFAGYEHEEQLFRAFYSNVAVLTETRRGMKYPLPLAELRRRVEAMTAPAM